MTNNAATAPLPTTTRTVKGALLVRGDVVVYGGAVLSIRKGSTKKVVRVCTAWDQTNNRVRTIRVRREADLPVVRLVTDER